jgi:pectinesterase
MAYSNSDEETEAEMRRAICWMGTGLLLAACAAQPAKAPSPESYTAETTYAKLAPTYPFIRIAGRAVPPTVRAVTDVTYVRRGAHDLKLDLYLPAGDSQAPRPAIVFVHGGGWRAGVRANFAPMAIRMAERGYVAATISYRLSPEAPSTTRRPRCAGCGRMQASTASIRAASPSRAARPAGRSRR